MKTNVKRLGMEDGRIAYEITIRKDHLLEDYAEMVKIQESSNGKRRFYICFEGFENKKECENFIKFAVSNNDFRNSHVRNNYQVTVSAITFLAA